jgi:hypothetical protein
MVSSWIRMVAATVAVLLGALVAAGTAASQATTEIIFETSEVEVAGDNPCSGEAILLTGEVHGFLRFTQTPSGQTTITGHVEGLLRGFGIPSGEPYLLQLVATESGEVVGQDGGTTVLTFTTTQQVITAGGNNDLYAHLTFHVTVVDGRTTAEVEEMRVECK